MRYILIPDVHGRDFWRSAVENRQKDDIVIFLGDYVDPYPNEKISNETALKGLEDISRNPGTLSFQTSSEKMMVSLFQSVTFRTAGFAAIPQDKLTGVSCMAGDILISHAGVYPDWMNLSGLSLEEFKNFNTDLHNPEKYDRVINALFCVDFWRGGWNKIGSPVWADIRCAVEHDTLGMDQIVGHTQLGKDPIGVGRVTCIDCRRTFILEDGELKEMDGRFTKILRQS